MSNKDRYLQRLRKEGLVDTEDVEYCYVQDLKKELLNDSSRPTSIKKIFRRPHKPKDRIIRILKPKPIFSSDKEDDSAEENEYELSNRRSWHSVHGAGLKKNPYLISKAALSYVATPRIIQLAKPRKL